MAKVMISLPDELLARVDAHATEHGSTRSATLRELAEAGLGERQRRLAQRMAALEGKASGHGGTAVQDLKAGPARVIFLDASVLLAAEDADDPEHGASVALLRTGELATGDLALYETTNVAQSRWRDDDAAARLRERIWTIAELGILIRADRQLGDEIARLTTEHALSAYDATYLAGAQRLGVVLASCDRRDLVAPGLARLPTSLMQT